MTCWTASFNPLCQIFDWGELKAHIGGPPLLTPYAPCRKLSHSCQIDLPDKRPGNESKWRNWHFFPFPLQFLPPSTSHLIPGSEERTENNLQVPWCLRLLCCTDLLEAAVSFSRHWTPVEVSIRHCCASAERHQRSHRGDRTRKPPSPRSEPPDYRPGLPGRLPQLLQALSLLPWYRWPFVRQRHKLSESVLRTWL